MFLNDSVIKSAILLNKGGLKNVLCKNNFSANSLGSQYFFETLQTSLIFQNSENVGKSGCFEKNLCDGESQFFFQMMEGYKVSCVKRLMF